MLVMGGRGEAGWGNEEFVKMGAAERRGGV